MDRSILERFRLPGPLKDHAAIAREGHDDACECDHCRVNSVMPNIVRRCHVFTASLRPRERHAFDLEDLLQEIWAELLLKAPKYRSDRSKYITFATLLADRKLGEIRNRWHTVAGPKDTPSRLRSTSGSSASTAERVRQTVRETTSLATDPADLLDGGHDAEGVAARSEAHAAAAAALADVLRELRPLRPLDVQILDHLWGLGDAARREVAELASLYRMSTAQVLARARSIEAEVRRRIAARMEAEGDAHFLDFSGVA